MPNSRRKLTLLGIILGLLLLVPFFWLQNNTKHNQKSVVENRKLQNFPQFLVFDNHKAKKYVSGISNIDFKHSFEQIWSSKFQRDFESAAYDQFPIKQTFVTISKTWDLFAINLAYLPLHDDYMPTDMTSNLYINKQMDFLSSVPLLYNKSVRDAIDLRLANYNFLINTYPTINFYAFYIEKLDASPIYSLNQYFPEADSGQSLEYFLTNKPKALKFNVFSFKNIDEYTTNFYRTDHHWNHIGSTKAYLQIHELLREGYPDISPALRSSEYLPTGNLMYSGSYARRSLYPITPDLFLIPNFHFLPFKYYKDGVETNLYPTKIPSRMKYTEYYAKYFGSNPGFREFDVINNSNRNLLLIGSSYAEPIAPVIAQHFAKTYFIDLRNYHDFSFRKFARSHPITDVLIIGASKEIFRDVDDWLITPIKKN